MLEMEFAKDIERFNFYFEMELQDCTNIEEYRNLLLSANKMINRLYKKYGKKIVEEYLK